MGFARVYSSSYAESGQKVTFVYHNREALMKAGWMTCEFTSFSTVFRSYQDDGRLMIKGCVQWRSVYG